MLLRVAEVVHPDAPVVRMRPLTAREGMKPYNPDGIERLKFWALGQGTQYRERCARVILSLSGGAGLWASEIIATQRKDLHFDDEGVLVTVHGSKARVVPMLAEWEPFLRVAVEGLEPDDYVFGDRKTLATHNVITAFITSSTMSSTTPRPQTHRLRATWLITHLAAGTDMKALMLASGVEKFENLSKLLKYVPDLDTPEYRRQLRLEANR
jgi:integrase